MRNYMDNKTQSAGQKRKQPTKPSTDATIASMAKPRKQYVTRYDAWKYFTKSNNDPENVRCNHCPSVFEYKSKSATSVLWTHHNACKGYKQLLLIILTLKRHWLKVVNLVSWCELDLIKKLAEKQLLR